MPSPPRSILKRARRAPKIEASRRSAWGRPKELEVITGCDAAGDVTEGASSKRRRCTEGAPKPDGLASSASLMRSRRPSPHASMMRFVFKDKEKPENETLHDSEGCD